MRELSFLKTPSPDFDSFELVIKGEKKPSRVYLVEFLVDEEVMEYITQKYIGKDWILLTSETRKEYQQQLIDFYYYMGYDYVPLAPEWFNLPDFKKRETSDTAELSRGKRSWVEEGGGIIKSWEDFNAIDWDGIKPDLWNLEYTQEKLPAGMKMTVYNTVFEMILERFLGYEDLFIFSYDKPELVEAVFTAWGEKVYQFYQKAIQFPKLGAIFHADDMGHKNSTLINPQFLRKNLFPWLKRYAELAHNQKKMFWMHSCGNISSVMGDLIEDVKIDAFHSFQDQIISVVDFMNKFGDRVAVLGGVDMDKLVRYSESNLRKYIKNILKTCMSGKYALGSGNTIANYVPTKNYLIMLNEGLNWNSGELDVV